MKLSDPDLDRQLKASVDRYDQLPAWVREASKETDRVTVVCVAERLSEAEALVESEALD